MNILDKLYSILRSDDLKLGYLPDTPDELTVITEYAGGSASRSFGSSDITENVQLRTRGAGAYDKISALAEKLDGYYDKDISVFQTSPVLDIGRDSKGRQEYTVNFKIIHYITLQIK